VITWVAFPSVTGTGNLKGAGFTTRGLATAVDGFGLGVAPAVAGVGAAVGVAEDVAGWDAVGVPLVELAPLAATVAGPVEHALSVTARRATGTNRSGLTATTEAQ
jgi:hypothetical protein